MNTLAELKAAIKYRRFGMLSKDFIFLHDNARRHVAIMWKDLLQCPYSPNHLLSDYHDFVPLKKATKEGESQKIMRCRPPAAEEWFRTLTRMFFVNGIQNLVDRWSTCLIMSSSLAKALLAK